MIASTAMYNSSQWSPFTDCRFFSGSKPCWEHKQNGTRCFECNSYQLFKEQILVDCRKLCRGFKDLQLIEDLKKEYPESELLLLVNQKVEEAPKSCVFLSTNSLDDYLYLKGLSLQSLLRPTKAGWLNEKIDVDLLFKVNAKGVEDVETESTKILIIKTGAAGDVLRTTPLLKNLRSRYPGAHITWITRFTEFVPSSWVDKVVEYSWQNCANLTNLSFDWVMNFDKQRGEVGLATSLKAQYKNGFVLNELGRTVPTDEKSQHKWLTGLFDPLLRKNSKSYLQETFEMVGAPFGGETYILEDREGLKKTEKNKIRVGLNIGAGRQWRETRLWPKENFALLIKSLLLQKYEVELLGGPLEHENNTTLQEHTGAIYRGVGDYDSFIQKVNGCDVVVTSVTMALHISLALEKRVVLFNNIFNKNEFHLYGLGTILEPNVKCVGCYKSKYDEGCEVKECMGQIKPNIVEEAIKKEIYNIRDGGS